MLTPETKTVAIQLPVSKIDCPRSGWSIKRIITETSKRKLNKYLTWEFFNLSKVNILTVTKIKKGKWLIILGVISYSGCVIDF